MNKNLLIGLSLAVLFQFFILTGMYVKAALPLWTGEEVRIKTIPVDPRSLFRGNYAQLRYDISEIKTKHFPNTENMRNGEVIYTVLKANDDNLYTFSRISLTQPDSGVFLRGRIENRWYEERTSYFRIKYGIEAYFVPKQKALALEKQLRNGGVAVLMVSDSGKARLKEVIGE